MAETEQSQELFAPGTILDIPDQQCFYQSINLINNNFINLINRNVYLAENKISNPNFAYIQNKKKIVKLTPRSYTANSNRLYVDTSTISLNVGDVFLNIQPNPLTTGKSAFPIGNYNPTKITAVGTNFIDLSFGSNSSFTIGQDYTATFFNLDEVEDQAYNMLTWSPQTRSWESKPFQGFGDVSARAWVSFQTNGLQNPTILASHNIKSVILGTNASLPRDKPFPVNANTTGHFFVTLINPLERPECCIVTSGCVPSGVATYAPEAGSYGIPYGDPGENPENGKTKRPDPETWLWPTPEQLYRTTGNSPTQVPRDYRNSFAIMWKPNGTGCDTGTIINAVVFSKTWDQSLLNPNPIKTVLGWDIDKLEKI